MTEGAEPAWLLIDAVLAIHKRLVAEHGGGAELRDRGLLESALDRPKNLFAYEDPRPSMTRLAASYAFGLAKNHPFVDGNKRIALTASAAFLQLNGLRLTSPEAEAVLMFQGLAAGTVSELEVAAWFEANSEPMIR